MNESGRHVWQQELRERREGGGVMHYQMRQRVIMGTRSSATGQRSQSFPSGGSGFVTPTVQMAPAKNDLLILAVTTVIDTLAIRTDSRAARHRRGAQHQEWDLGPRQRVGLCQRPGSQGQVTSNG